MLSEAGWSNNLTERFSICFFFPSSPKVCLAIKSQWRRVSATAVRATRTKRSVRSCVGRSPQQTARGVPSSRPAGDQAMPGTLLELGHVESSHSWSRSSRRNGRASIAPGSHRSSWGACRCCGPDPGLGPSKNNVLSLTKL